MKLLLVQDQHLYALTSGEIMFVDQKTLATQSIRSSHTSRVTSLASR